MLKLKNFADIPVSTREEARLSRPHKEENVVGPWYLSAVDEQNGFGFQGDPVWGDLNENILSNVLRIRGWSRQFSSVTQLCPTLCDPMNCSTPGLPVHHQLPELTQTHVHRVGDAIQPSHSLSSPLLLPSIFPSIRVFSMSQLFASGGQSITHSYFKFLV